ncbi:MAG: sulfur carrier protein ThiS [Paracoccaceae bacterium]|jgi:sulfur carrier protein|nr:sulfur carrier protein ThiS [Paracoccaceae bacterium]MDG1371359.1 sulfur carrier protein ThiS [Paracoccaceae bacterium]MDG1971311.1 sulfur carrier protein ThiS [Paracoccaceae bacterium]
MKIDINGKAHDVRGPMLADALEELGYDGKIATAVNEAFVAKTQRAAYVLKDGDRVEVVAPKQGG